MKTADKRVVVALAIIGGAVILAVGIALTKPDEKADERPNERHTVWADEDGFFHGRVDYWQTE